jgi:predicted O-methyltransferase YrrM
MNDLDGTPLNKLFSRIRKDGLLATGRYFLNRPALRKAQLAADQKVRVWNDHFFSYLGVARKDAEYVLEETRQKVPLLEADVHVQSQAPQSTHLLAFSALKVAGFEPASILEIGTYLGYTTCFLSHLFERATIYTTALPADDPVFDDYHILDAPGVADVYRKRLDRANIDIIQKNSGFLWQEKLPDFDLIWLDGGHQYPVVAWDHFYSLSKLAAGGWLFSDDIVEPSSDTESPYEPRFHAFHTIDYYNARMKNKFQYLLKREDAGTYLYARKYIAYLHHKD